MESIFRRNSGIYFARLVVPVQFRRLLGKTELIATTGVRDAPLAKIIGGEILAAWRRHSLELDGQARVDLVRLTVGSPTLSGSGQLPLLEAAQQSGIGLSTLIRYATDGRLRLYVATQSLPGFVVRLDELDRDVDEFSEGKIVPIPTFMPESAIATVSPCAIRLSTSDAEAAAPDLLAGRGCRFVLFEMPGQPNLGFAPTGGMGGGCQGSCRVG